MCVFVCVWVCVCIYECGCGLLLSWSMIHQQKIIFCALTDEEALKDYVFLNDWWHDTCQNTMETFLKFKIPKIILSRQALSVWPNMGLKWQRRERRKKRRDKVWLVGSALEAKGYIKHLQANGGTEPFAHLHNLFSLFLSQICTHSLTVHFIRNASTPAHQSANHVARASVNAPIKPQNGGKIDISVTFTQVGWLLLPDGQICWSPEVFHTQHFLEQ